MMFNKPPCLIPARGGSKRFPRKNIALLRGKPLLGYVIEAALQSKVFSEIWVSTEDPEITEVARNYGAVVHDRPQDLAGDRATLVEVGLDFVNWLENQCGKVDVLGIVLPTAALVWAEDLCGGFELLKNRAADFVMGVTTYLDPPFQALQEVDGYLKLFWGMEYAKQSQTLPHVQVDSGYFYIVRVEALRREQTLYGERLVGYPIPRVRSIDIDEPIHLVFAEALLDAIRKGSPQGIEA